MIAMRIAKYVFCFCILYSASGEVPNFKRHQTPLGDLLPLQAGDSAIKIPGKCPSSFLEWKEAREALRKSSELNDVFALGVLLEHCSSEEDQKSFFNDGRFLACMSGIRGLTSLSFHSKSLQTEKLKLQLNENVPQSAFTLPSPMQNADLFNALRAKDEDKIEKEIAKISQANPASVTFKYKSQIEDETDSSTTKPTDFWVTVYPENGIEKTIHYEGFPTIIMVSKITKDSIGNDLADPIYLMGRFLNASSEPDGIVMEKTNQEGKKDIFVHGGVILASGLKTPMDITGSRLHCFACHQGSRFIPLFPAKPEETKSYSPVHSSSEVVEWFNKSHVKAESSDYHKMHSFLPVFGERDASIDENFVQQCTGITEPASVTKLYNAMNCATCHDTSKVDPLIFPFEFQMGARTKIVHGKAKITKISSGSLLDDQSPPQFEKMVLDLMLGSGHMPPKADDEKHAKYLSPPERKALEDCLLIDYFGNMYQGTKKKGMNHEGRLLKKLLENECPAK
jgi:hypothetical protein